MVLPASAVIWRPAWFWGGAEPARPAEIQVTALTLPGPDGAAEALTPVTSPVPAPQIEAAATPEPALAPDASPILQNEALPVAPPPETPKPSAAMPPAPEAPPGGDPAAEADPRLIDLFDRIRSRVFQNIHLGRQETTFIPEPDRIGGLRRERAGALIGEIRRRGLWHGAVQRAENDPN